MARDKPDGGRRRRQAPAVRIEPDAVRISTKEYDWDLPIDSVHALVLLGTGCTAGLANDRDLARPPVFIDVRVTGTPPTVAMVLAPPLSPPILDYHPANPSGPHRGYVDVVSLVYSAPRAIKEFAAVGVPVAPSLLAALEKTIGTVGLEPDVSDHQERQPRPWLSRRRLLQGIAVVAAIASTALAVAVARPNRPVNIFIALLCVGSWMCCWFLLLPTIVRFVGWPERAYYRRLRRKALASREDP